MFEIYNKQYKEHMFVDNCFEEMMEGYRMSTRRIYLEGLKETDENADKKIYVGNNYSGYNRVSIRRKRNRL